MTSPVLPMAVSTSLPSAPEPRKRNVLRDTAIRYLGYTGDVAEALSPYVNPKMVFKGNLVGNLYTTADLVSLTTRKYAETSDSSKKEGIKAAGYELMDGAMFHAAATMLIPTLIVRRIRRLTHAAVSQSARFGRYSTPVAATTALVSIPALSKPLDATIDGLLNLTYRPLVKGATKVVIKTQQALVPRLKRTHIFHKTGRVSGHGPATIVPPPLFQKFQ